MPRAANDGDKGTANDAKARYQALFDNSPLCVHEIDSSGRIQAINRVGMSWAGVKDAADLIGTPYLDLVADNDRDRVELTMARTCDGEAAEIDHKGRDGALFRTKFAAIEAAGAAHLLCLTQDVTETQHREQRFAEIQMRDALILGSAGEGIHGLDADGRITFGNAAAERILGWKTDDILGMRSHDLHHHSYPDGSKYPREKCPIYAALTDGQVHQVDDEVFWHTDGSAVPVEYTSTPILTDGRPDGAVVVFRDISARIEAKAEREKTISELAQLSGSYQAILDSAGEGIYGLDHDGRITFGNQAATDILGWDPEEVLGQKGHVVHHHSYADGSAYPQDECPIYAALKDGEIHRVDDEVFWRNDGSAVPVEYTSTPIIRDGKPAGAVVIFRDVSKRKELEAQRQTAFDEVRQLKEQLEQERDYLRDEVNVALHYGDIVGESQALKRTLAQVTAVASTSANVIILGESGVGKELVARAIHAQSSRADKALVKVNCASIPRDLFESEFFGHVKGSFTGAQRDRVGRLQLADQGTLFLDEVGEIPLSQQGKLLRALQENEFERVGDEETTKVDVRVVAATNRDLSEEAKAGRFREDLYYRLSVFPINVPPLRERADDIAPLAMHFLQQIAVDLGRENLRLRQQHLSLLEKHLWPGNIRELRNVIERAAISSTGTNLRIDLALPDGAKGSAPSSRKTQEDESSFVTDAEFRLLEKANIIAALNQSAWRIWGDHGAAELLGLNPSTLKYRMKQLGVRKVEP